MYTKENTIMEVKIDKTNYYNEFNKPEPKRIDSTKVNKRLVNYDRKDEILYLKRISNILTQINPELFECEGYSYVPTLKPSSR